MQLLSFQLLRLVIVEELPNYVRGDRVLLADIECTAVGDVKQYQLRAGRGLRQITYLAHDLTIWTAKEAERHLSDVPACLGVILIRDGLDC